VGGAFGHPAAGRSNAGIAAKLVVSVPAVERHVTSIFSKLGLRQSDAAQNRRGLAVLRYLQS
jgi:DNA-binding NarL/FixJ family response regulator